MFKDKVAIITGASRGIGRELAVGFAEAGAHLILAARTVKDLQVTENLVKDRNVDAISVPTDVADFSSIRNMVEKGLHHYGRIDILVNNAGIAPAVKRAERWTPEEWQSVIQVDLTGVFLCCLAVAPHMIKEGRGSIIINSSFAAQATLYGQAPYCAAKAGVVQLVRALAVEWAKYNIRVNCVGPGSFELGLGKRIHEVEGRYYKYLLRNIPMRRFGKPEELVPLFVFLASDAAGYITGQTILVDGGASIVH